MGRDGDGDGDETTVERVTVPRGPSSGDASTLVSGADAGADAGADDIITAVEGPPPSRLADEEVLARLRAVPKIGRFTILRPLGEGGMGQVVLAYDEELDRKVALKMIRGRHAEDLGLRRRFIREAQALARLSHPNVVTIYEVGEHLGRPFLAMELVVGPDLRRWLRAEKRPRAEILRVFSEAGRGLAAAHAAGIIHRDFKPTNVLVGDDGRVRVVDFGLARAAAADDGRDQGLTVVGTVLGTPAYMAPEQVLGAEVDGRCDQYAFAVALHEALSGARPKLGRTLQERRQRVMEEPVLNADLQPRLRRILRRALDPSPAARYPSMDALIAELSVDPQRWWARGAVALALVCGAAFVGQGLGAAVDPCAGGEDRLRGAWDPEIAVRLREALAGDEPGHRADEADRLVAILEGHAESWVESERLACSAHQRGESSGATFDEQGRCLDRERDRLRGLVGTLLGGGVEELDAALVAAQRLPPLSRCLDLEGVSHGPPQLSPEIRDEVDALRAELVGVEVARSLGTSPATLATAARIVDRSHELDAPGLESQALKLRGQLRADLGDYEEGARDLEAALWMSEANDDPIEAADAMASLVHVLGDRLGRLEEAVRWRPHADMLIARVGQGSLSEARVAWAFGAVALHHRQIDRALVDLQRALTVAESHAGPESMLVAGYLGNLGAALGGKGDYAGAGAAFRRSLTIMEASLGPEHGTVMTLLGNLANVHIAVGESVEALALLRDLLARALRSRGPDHPQTALVRLSLARALIRVEAWAPAKEQLLLAVAVQRERLGLHRELFAALETLSAAESELGEHHSAGEHAEERLELAKALFAEDSPEILEAYVTMAERELAADHPAEVARVVTEALEQPLDRTARESPDVIFYLRYHLVWALDRQGRRGAAAELAAEVHRGLAEEPTVYRDELVFLEAVRAKVSARGGSGEH